MRALVSSGHLIWTKWTEFGSASEAFSIASRTATAVAWTWAIVPISSGRRSRVKAAPMARAGVAADTASLIEKTRKCGDSPPSVPPDMIIETRFPASCGLQPSLSAKSPFSTVTA